MLVGLGKKPVKSFSHNYKAALECTRRKVVSGWVGVWMGLVWVKDTGIVGVVH